MPSYGVSPAGTAKPILIVGRSLKLEGLRGQPQIDRDSLQFDRYICQRWTAKAKVYLSSIRQACHNFLTARNKLLKIKSPDFIDDQKCTIAQVEESSILPDPLCNLPLSPLLSQTLNTALVLPTLQAACRVIMAPTKELGFVAALEEAQAGASEGGIPIGACLVSKDGEILGRGHNQRVQRASAILHVSCIQMSK